MLRDEHYLDSTSFDVVDLVVSSFLCRFLSGQLDHINGLSTEVQQIPLQLSVNHNTTLQNLFDDSSDGYQHKAQLHWRLMPLLLDIIKSYYLSDKFSPGVIEKLSKKVLTGTLQERLKQQQLERLAELLTSHQIPVLLLKSSAFSRWLYSEQVPRLSSDIDILVQHDDWERTVRILNECMTQVAKPVTGVFDDLYELSFKPQNEKFGFEVDLHLSLTHPTLFDIDLDDVWERSFPHPAFSDPNIRMMSVNDALNHQAIHSFKDAQYKSYSLIDSALLLSHGAEKGIEETDLYALFDLAIEQKTDIALWVLLNHVARATNDSSLSANLHQVKQHLPLRLNVVRLGLIKVLLTFNITPSDILNKTLYYRFVQMGFQLLYSRKTISVFKLQFAYVQQKIRGILK